jgi:serine/threonine-protein phosphatase 5
VALRQLKQAVDSFLTVCKMQPKNADARAKYELTKKEHRLLLLAAAVVNDEKRASLDFKDIHVESSYSGPKLDSTDDITPKWVETLMEWQKDGKILHKKYAVMIINKATELFEKDESLVSITIDDLEEITVCGDIHGQYFDMLNIFKLNGNPSHENPYLFNGDFIDRGSFSVEVVMTMLAWKVCLP